MSEQPKFSTSLSQGQEQPGKTEQEPTIKECLDNLTQAVTSMAIALALVGPTFLEITLEQQRAWAERDPSEGSFPVTEDLHGRLMENNGPYAELQRLQAEAKGGSAKQEESPIQPSETE